MTPYAGLSLSNAGERIWRAGASWVLSPGIASRLEGERKEWPGESPTFAVTQRVTLHW